MAARLNTRQADNTRKAIKTTLLVKKLQKHALNEDDTEMSVSQIQAARILLGKAIPDLKQLDIDANVDQTLTVVRKEYKPKKGNS